MEVCMLKLMLKVSLSALFMPCAFIQPSFANFEDDLIDGVHFTLHKRNLGGYHFKNHSESASFQWLTKKGVPTFSVSPDRDSIKTLPASADLSHFCPEVFDQGKLGSCTANAIAGAMQTSQIRDKETEVNLSRLFIYYNERKLEGTVAQDAGALISDGLKTVSKQGACSEALWTYSDGKAKYRVSPTKNCYKEGLNNVVLDKVTALTPDLTTLKTVLAQNIPFVFGILVYDSMMTNEVAKTGVVPMPSAADNQVGGHALMMVGYDDTKQAFKFRNSWSNMWGQEGYGWIPYDYITDANLSQEFFAIDKIGALQPAKPHHSIPILSGIVHKVEDAAGNLVNRIVH